MGHEVMIQIIGPRETSWIPQVLSRCKESERLKMIPSQVHVKVASFLKSTISLIPTAYWSSLIYQDAFCNYKGWFGSGMICPTVEPQIKTVGDFGSSS